VTNLAREDGFTITELLVSTTIMLIVVAAALQTFNTALAVNDAGAQLSDSNQNLRAGTNQLIKDIMQAGRIIGPEGIPVPSGAGAAPINRPSPPNTVMAFDVTTTTNLPDITTGKHLGPNINGSHTDMITLMTVDAFMPTLETPANGTIDSQGAFVTMPATSPWLVGDTVNDTPPIIAGDLILFKNASGMAIQSVTRVDSTKIYFEANDWFGFNQRAAAQGTVLQIKGGGAAFQQTTLFRAVMKTYYVDATTTPGSPRLTMRTNHFEPQALAGVVEDLHLSYDLVDGVNNPTDVESLPFTDDDHVVYTSNQIRKVNLHVGVRSEIRSKQSQDFVRNHVSTAVDVRSLASIDRYK
jgi:prepilin-type N-terminal cleavage/methylation domain-containing protein